MLVLNKNGINAVAMITSGIKYTVKSAMSGPERVQWENARHEEIVRLVDTTSTCAFVNKNMIPSHKEITYYNEVLSTKINSKGDIIYRVRGSAGGDKINFKGDRYAPTAEMVTTKVLLNATLNEDANWMTLDLRDFYLKTVLEDPEYMRIHRRQLTASTIQLYNLEDKFDDQQYVYMRLDNCLYGLPQAGKLSYQKLKILLSTHGYNETTTTCLFKHETLNIMFVLVVDDFGIKYKSVEDVYHLISTLSTIYDMTIDWTGSKFLGMNIEFEGELSERKVSLSMPDYYKNMLAELGVTHESNVESPLLYTPPSYGSKTSQSEFRDETPVASQSDIDLLQTGIGKLGYIGMAVDHLILPAVSKLASIQTAPTKHNIQEFNRLLQYVATHPNPKLVYSKGNMRLVAHTDASFMSETRCRTRAADYLYLSSVGPSLSPEHPDLNGAILCTSTIIPLTIPSVMEGEYVAIYNGVLKIINIRDTLLNLGYPQNNPSVLVCDNQAAVSVANRKCSIKKSKSTAMRYYIVQDEIDKRTIDVTWRPGIDKDSGNPINLADAFTKAHPVHYFKKIRPFYTQ
jgi:hypothetical protein